MAPTAWRPANAAQHSECCGPAPSQPTHVPLARDPASEDLFIPGKDDRFHFDLPGFCGRQLSMAGLGHVENLGLDTCALEEIYFSNRRRNLRGEADYGRNASVIVIST